MILAHVLGPEDASYDDFHFMNNFGRLRTDYDVGRPSNFNGRVTVPTRKNAEHLANCEVSGAGWVVTLHTTPYSYKVLLVLDSRRKGPWS